MVARRPLVNISGQTTELPPGDSVVGGSVGTLTAGSGLNGGGDLSSVVTTNISLAPNPSGLLFADGKLGVDGVAGVTASTAFASGNFSLSVGIAALASGVAGSSLAATALASGNAALADIAAIPGGTIETFTAASAVASGYAVGLDGAGRVQSIRQITDANSRSFGSAVVFESAAIYYNSTIRDSSNNRIVTAYADGGNSFYGTVIVGTVSGSSISFGTAVVFRSAVSEYPSATFDSTNNRVVIAYMDGGNSNFGTAIVGTVSGSSISFGTAVVFRSATTQIISATYNSVNNRVVISYRDNTNSSYGTAIVGTVSGTSISFGTAAVFQSSSTNGISSTYDSTNNRIVTAYYNLSNSSYGTVAVGTVSGTSISFGTPVIFRSAAVNYISTTYDSSNNRVVIAYADNGNSDYGTAIVGTVSGTSISFGTAVVFESASTGVTYASYDSSNNQIIIVYADNGNSGYGTLVVGTVSGTSISFGTPVVFASASSSYISSVFDATANRTVITYSDNLNAQYGTAVVAGIGSSIFPTISSQNNFIGIAQSTVASGSAVQVRLPGSYDQNNTGLTPGAVYYVNPTTSGFTTTATQPSAWSGAVNWGPVGRAVNSTTLLLTDMI